MAELGGYMEYYCERRIKESLGWMSPNEYRRSQGYPRERSRKLSAPLPMRTLSTSVTKCRLDTERLNAHYAEKMILFHCYSRRHIFDVYIFTLAVQFSILISLDYISVAVIFEFVICCFTIFVFART